MFGIWFWYQQQSFHLLCEWNNSAQLCQTLFFYKILFILYCIFISISFYRFTIRNKIWIVVWNWYGSLKKSHRLLYIPLTANRIDISQHSIKKLTISKFRRQKKKKFIVGFLSIHRCDIISILWLELIVIPLNTKKRNQFK